VIAVRLLLPLAFLVVFATVAVPAIAASPKRADARLDRALEDLVEMDGGPPGVAAIIDRGGRTRLHRGGVGSVPTERPFRKRDHMRIFSVAKSFSGAVALSLVDRGSLSLDDTIGEVLPSLPAAWSDVTLREALNHTAGLPDYIKSPEFAAEFSANPRQYLSPLQLIAFVADEDLNFPAGSRYEYSDTDNIVVGLMAEAVSPGAPYWRLLRRLVYKPLGMKQTSLPDGFQMPTPFIHGYALELGQPPADVSQALGMSGAWASGGIVSTPADLNRFIRGYGGGALFGKAVRRHQFEFVGGGESQPPGPGPNSAGLGIFRYEARCGTVFGASGNGPGYVQVTATTRNGRRSMTVSANSQFSPTTGAPGVFDRLRRAYELAVCAAVAGRGR
jgi:D-alanyl-D-alanine carboxypeptidase